MIRRCLLLTALQMTSCWCQYMVDSSVRADMSFDDENDRFDVGNIIEEQNRMFEDQPTAMDMGARRSGRFDDGIPLVEVLRYNRRLLNANRKTQPRRSQADFAYHDLMQGQQDADDEAYERNLLRFQAQNARRTGLDVIDLEKSGNQNVLKLFVKKKNARRNNQDNGVDVKTNSKSLQDIVLKYLHQGKVVRRRNGRRGGLDPNDEIMLGYAVPFNLQVNGYLEPDEE